MNNRERLCVVVGACDPGRMIIPADAYVIACDGGLRHLADWEPDLIVGDFDSFDLEAMPQAFRGIELIKLPCEKDDTDIMAALRAGLDRGFRKFLLYGCMGGRPDHAYANYQVLGWLTAHGARGYLYGDGWLVTHIENCGITLHGRRGDTFSVFAPEGEAKNISITFAKYDLNGYDMQGSFPIGVSNEFDNSKVRISVGEGKLLILWQGDLTKGDIL